MGDLVISERQMNSTLDVLKGFLKGAADCSRIQDKFTGIGEVNIVLQGVLQALPSRLPGSTATSEGTKAIDAADASSLSEASDVQSQSANDAVESGLTKPNLPFREVFGIQGDLDAKTLVAIHQEMMNGLIHDLESKRRTIEDAVIPVANDWADAKKAVLTLDDTIETAKLRLPNDPPPLLFIYFVAEFVRNWSRSLTSKLKLLRS